jgi:hypothetical protein
MEGLKMKELSIDNFAKTEKGNYTGAITFGYYLYLIQNNFITVPEIDGYHRATAIATNYNNDKNLKTIEDFTIVLHVIDNKENSIEIQEREINIKADTLTLVDGGFRTMVISELDERFMDSLLNVSIYFSSVDEMQKLFMQLNSPNVRKREDGTKVYTVNGRESIIKPFKKDK